MTFVAGGGSEKEKIIRHKVKKKMLDNAKGNTGERVDSDLTGT